MCLCTFVLVFVVQVNVSTVPVQQHVITAQNVQNQFSVQVLNFRYICNTEETFSKKMHFPLSSILDKNANHIFY